MLVIKKIVAFLFIALIFGSSMRYLVFSTYIGIQKDQFRREVIIDRKISETFDLNMNVEDLFQNKNGVEWKEKNQELVINGIYYEVIDIRKNGEFAIVRIINDKHENNLFNHYLATNNLAKDHSSGLIIDLLKLQFLLPEFKFELNALESMQKHIELIPALLTHYPLERIKPPCSRLV